MCIGVPAQILSIEGEELERHGQVRFPDGDQNVSLACLPEAEVGDYVIVHAGIAISCMTRDEAQVVLEDLRQIEQSLPKSGAS